MNWNNGVAVSVSGRAVANRVATQEKEEVMNRPRIRPDDDGEEDPSPRLTSKDVARISQMTGKVGRSRRGGHRRDEDAATVFHPWAMPTDERNRR